jgi:hypothetical protein
VKIDCGVQKCNYEYIAVEAVSVVVVVVVSITRKEITSENGTKN